jgi:hypothetical protein
MCKVPHFETSLSIHKQPFNFLSQIIIVWNFTRSLPWVRTSGGVGGGGGCSSKNEVPTSVGRVWGMDRKTYQLFARIFLYMLGRGEFNNDSRCKSYLVIIKFIDMSHPCNWHIQISHNDNHNWPLKKCMTRHLCNNWITIITMHDT